ncbi:retrotransposon unclassified [Hordeum vulgare]|nr:retrotransposon unclassified [Hordeum vulgare]
MHRLLRRSRSADLDATANLPPLAPLATVPPAPTAPGAGLLPHAPAPAAVPAAPAATPLHHGVGRDLVPCLDIVGAQAPAPASADGLPPTITHFLRFKLDLAASNYSKWRHLFYCILCKYNAQQHVDQDRDPVHEDAVWRHDDITIVLWISSTISVELYDIVVSPPNIPAAYQIWQTLRFFFLDNQAGRAIHLSAEFRGMVQGDLPVAEYARRLQSLAAGLADVEEPITDRTLMLQFIHGLSRWFCVLDGPSSACVVPQLCSGPVTPTP